MIRTLARLVLVFAFCLAIAGCRQQGAQVVSVPEVVRVQVVEGEVMPTAKQRFGLDTTEDVLLHGGSADIYVYSDDHSTTKFSVVGSSGNTTVAGSLSLAGTTISGFSFGAATDVVSGTLIAHGFSVTPTVVLLTPVSATGALTLTTQIMASNATSFTVGIETPGTTISTLYWLAVR